ncbi:rhomboid family intramembrane serine protease [Pseudonocardiaceae bacterium YIM PH 21723]|nr:rhomboid family intramembrane serine protease [Pseudonocardiaceae bacterium YIM PH 21723]
MQHLPAQPNSVHRVIPREPLRAASIMLSLALVLYLVQAVNQLTGDSLSGHGIVPRTADGIQGVLFAPLLHAGWDHLITNTFPLLLFGWLALAAGVREWLWVTALIWLGGGAATWLFAASHSNHIGASGVIFGWLTFLLTRGIFNLSYKQIFVSLFLLFYWGGVLWGVLPGRPEISWQGHLFGALFGILAAWFARERRLRKPLPPTKRLTA